MSALVDALRDGADQGGQGVAAALADEDPWDDARRHAGRMRRQWTLRGVGVLGAMGGSTMLALAGWGVSASSYEFADPALGGAQAPIRVAGMDLTCGADLTGARPSSHVDWAPASDLSIRGEVSEGRQATVAVRVSGLSADVELRATAMLALDGRIVAAMPVGASGGVAQAALSPGDCMAGTLNPALLASAEAAGELGRALTTHLGVVALDSDGEVVGHWFDPPGSVVSFVPGGSDSVVDGWCPAVRI